MLLKNYADVCLLVRPSLVPRPLSENREGVWQHIIHCRVRTHCTVRAKQVTEFKYITLIENVLTMHPDKALDFARVRVESARLRVESARVRVESAR